MTKRNKNLIIDVTWKGTWIICVATSADCIRNFGGAVVCVSQDQFFVQSVINEAWVVGDSAVSVWRALRPI